MYLYHIIVFYEIANNFGSDGMGFILFCMKFGQ